MFPFIELSSTLTIPTYLLVISLTYCLCIYWVYRRSLATHEAHPPLIALDLCLTIMVGGLIGARGLHVFYEDWNYYASAPADIFKLWQGGFVFYGGFFGALLASWIFLRWKRLSFWSWADFMAPALALGYALGRLGCFLNGCCFGAPCDRPWAVEFTYPGLPTGLRHPTQLYATLWELGAVGLLLFLETRRRRRHDPPTTSTGASPFFKAGSLFLTWLILHAGGRLVMERYRDDYRGDEILGLSLATAISWLLILGSTALLLKNRRSAVSPGA